MAEEQIDAASVEPADGEETPEPLGAMAKPVKLPKQPGAKKGPEGGKSDGSKKDEGGKPGTKSPVPDKAAGGKDDKKPDKKKNKNKMGKPRGRKAKKGKIGGKNRRMTKKKAKATPAGELGEGELIIKKRKRKHKGMPTYSSFIYKVLKQVHPELGISKRGMNIMNSFMSDIFDRIATESNRLLRSMSRRTLSGREVQTCVRLLLPGELAKHAVSEGTKAVNKFFNEDGEGEEGTTKLPQSTPASPPVTPAASPKEPPAVSMESMPPAESPISSPGGPPSSPEPKRIVRRRAQL